MILHDITVGGFRTYANPIHVGPFDERITVIHAPNGTGKTTLLDALYAGLLESHTLTGDKAETSMRSSAGALVPSVCIEFSTGGKRYKIEKRFLDGGYSRLYEFAGSTCTLVSEGEAAVTFVRGLVGATKPGRGPMKRDEHFGLGAILWSAQGNVALEKLPANLATLARTQLGGRPTTSGVDVAVKATAEAWFLKFYTSQGKESEAEGTVNLPALRAAVQQARVRSDDAQRELAAIDALRKTLQDAEIDRERWSEKYASYEAELATCRAHVTAYTAAANAVAREDAASAAAAERYTEAHAKIRAIDRARTNVNAATKLLAECDAALAAARAAHEAAAAIGVGAETTWRIAAEEWEGAQVELAIAQDAEALAAERRALASDEERLDRKRATAIEIDRLQALRDALLAPGSKDIKAIRKLNGSIATLGVQLEAAVLHVTYVPLAGQAVDIVTGSLASRSGDAADSRAIEVTGSPVVEFEIAGAGRIRASGPSDSASALTAKLAEENALLAELVRPFGTNDTPELERRYERATELDGDLKARRRDIDGDAEPLDALRTTVERSQRAIDQILARRPDWAALAPDPEPLRAATHGRFEAAREKRVAAEAGLAVARSNVKACDETLGPVAAARADAKSACDQAQAQVSVREDDGFDDATREARCRDLAIEQIAADEAAKAARKGLDAFGCDPQARVVELEAARKAAGDDRETAVAAHSDASARLDVKSNAGCYDVWVRAEEDLDQAQRTLAAAEAEAKAAKLLHDTFKRVTAEYESAYLQPIRRHTAELYARVSGEDADVRFNADLTFEGIARGDKTYFETLSTGEREQVQMVGRLALADLLSGQERQLVVLDDVMQATDPHRFPRFLELLREFAQDRMQFVIATSDKARYPRLTEATFVDLGALRRPVVALS